MATLAFVTPFVVTSAGCVAFAIAERQRADGDSIVIWFTVLAITVFLQSTILLPFGLRRRRRADADNGPSSRTVPILILGLALLAIVLLVASMPAELYQRQSV